MLKLPKKEGCVAMFINVIVSALTWYYKKLEAYSEILHFVIWQGKKELQSSNLAWKPAIGQWQNLKYTTLLHNWISCTVTCS